MHMSKRMWIFLLAITVSVTVISVGICASEEQKASAGDTKNLDVIIIDKDDYSKDRKGPVTFSHRKHAKEYNISCWNCHHEYDEGTNTWSPWSDETLQCQECHDPDEQIDEVMRLQTAFHVNCKTCHKTLANENKKTGPYRKCLGCHDKK